METYENVQSLLLYLCGPHQPSDWWFCFLREPTHPQGATQQPGGNIGAGRLTRLQSPARAEPPPAPSSLGTARGLASHATDSSVTGGGSRSTSAALIRNLEHQGNRYETIYFKASQSNL